MTPRFTEMHDPCVLRLGGECDSAKALALLVELLQFEAEDIETADHGDGKISIAFSEDLDEGDWHDRLEIAIEDLAEKLEVEVQMEAVAQSGGDLLSGALDLLADENEGAASFTRRHSTSSLRSSHRSNSTSNTPNRSRPMTVEEDGEKDAEKGHAEASPAAAEGEAPSAPPPLSPLAPAPDSPRAEGSGEASGEAPSAAAGSGSPDAASPAATTGAAGSSHTGSSSMSRRNRRMSWQSAKSGLNPEVAAARRASIGVESVIGTMAEAAAAAMGQDGAKPMLGPDYDARLRRASFTATFGTAERKMATAPDNDGTRAPVHSYVTNYSSFSSKGVASMAPPTHKPREVPKPGGDGSSTSKGGEEGSSQSMSLRRRNSTAIGVPDSEGREHSLSFTSRDERHAGRRGSVGANLLRRNSKAGEMPMVLAMAQAGAPGSEPAHEDDAPGPSLSPNYDVRLRRGSFKATFGTEPRNLSMETECPIHSCARAPPQSHLHPPSQPPPLPTLRQHAAGGLARELRRDPGLRRGEGDRQALRRHVEISLKIPLVLGNFRRHALFPPEDGDTPPIRKRCV